MTWRPGLLGGNNLVQQLPLVGHRARHLGIGQGFKERRKAG
jgi:hypothetical protein